MSKQSIDLSQHSWAEARAIIKAEMEARDPDDYEHGGCCSDCDGDHDEPTYDCSWCKDGEDTTAPCICNADLRDEHEENAMAYALGMQKYAAALDAARAQIEANPHGYGPFKEAMTIAYAECNLLHGTNFGMAWHEELEKYDVIRQYRVWCCPKGAWPYQ